MTRAPLALALSLAFLAPAPLLAQEEPPPAAAPTIELAAGRVMLAELVERWARATDRTVSVDPQLQQVYEEMAEPTTLDHAALRAILELHDAVLVEEPGGILRAHHVRTAASKVGPHTRVVAGGEVPSSDQLVTWVGRVKHGNGAGIFSSLRGPSDEQLQLGLEYERDRDQHLCE